MYAVYTRVDEDTTRGTTAEQRPRGSSLPVSFYVSSFRYSQPLERLASSHQHILILPCADRPLVAAQPLKDDRGAEDCRLFSVALIDAKIDSSPSLFRTGRAQNMSNSTAMFPMYLSTPLAPLGSTVYFRPDVASVAIPSVCPISATSKFAIVVQLKFCFFLKLQMMKTAHKSGGKCSLRVRSDVRRYCRTVTSVYFRNGMKRPV